MTAQQEEPGPDGMTRLGLPGMQGWAAPFQPAGQWSMELQEAALAHGCWDESKFVGVQFVTQCWRDRNSLGPLHGHTGADAKRSGPVTLVVLFAKHCSFLGECSSTAVFL